MGYASTWLNLCSSRSQSRFISASSSHHGVFHFSENIQLGALGSDRPRTNLMHLCNAHQKASSEISALESIYIWSVDGLTFELLVERWLFNPEDGGDWRLEDDHLAKILKPTDCGRSTSVMKVGNPFSPPFFHSPQFKYHTDENLLLNPGKL